MKTILLSFILLTVALVVQAGTPEYEKIMLETIESVYNAESIAQYQEAINMFERIASKETAQWEPHYYAGFGYVMMAIKSERAAEKDNFLDLAMDKVKKGVDLAPQESELAALEGFVHMIRVTVDPAVRGPQYAPLSMQSFGKALAFNPDNPRALYLMGQMEFGTAKFFSSDTSEACAKLRSAVEKFENEQPENPLAPAWGKKGASAAAGRCE